MAKVTGPLLSLGASGTVADTTTFGRWKGIPYVRQKVDPSNPNTSAQQATRTVFKAAGESWRLIPSGFAAPWDAFVKGRPLTQRNAYIGAFTKLLRSKSDLADWQVSPGAKSGPALAAHSAAGGASPGEIDVTYTTPSVPNGWTLDKVVHVYAEDHDPSTAWTQEIGLDDDATANGSYTISGLNAGVDYAVSSYTVFTRDDGSTAYGISATDIATATA